MQSRIMKLGIRLLGGLLLLAGCSQEVALPTDTAVMNFSLSGIGTGVTTRGEALASGTTVRVVVYRGTTYVADNVYTADASGKLTSTTEMRLIEDTYDFYAVSPALAIASKTTTGPTFTVGQNVDFAAVKVSQKVTKYSGSSSTTKCQVALGELARKCAKLVFTVDLAEDASGNINKTVITQVALSDMPASLTAKGDALERGSGSNQLTVPADSFKTDLVDFRKASGSTVVLPKVSGKFNLTMKARFNGVTSVTTSFPATSIPAMSFDAGKTYTFTVKLTKDNLGNPTVGLWLTVSPWITSDQEYGLGGVPTGPVTTQLLGYWTDITWGDVSLGGFPAGSVITGVSGWWKNHYDNPHLGSSDAGSND